MQLSMFSTCSVTMQSSILIGAFCLSPARAWSAALEWEYSRPTRTLSIRHPVAPQTDVILLQGDDPSRIQIPVATHHGVQDGTSFSIDLGTTPPGTSSYYRLQFLNSRQAMKTCASSSIQTTALRQGGTVWDWGYRPTGDRVLPERMGGISNVIGVSRYAGHAVMLTSSGGLFAMGVQGYPFGTIVSVAPETRWQMASAGAGHTLAVAEDGTLWAWGGNSVGQLGTGDYQSYSFPVKIGTNRTWRYVSAGSGYSMAIQKDGSLWGWGQNTFGQLGNGRQTDERLPFRIGNDTDWETVAVDYYNTAGIKRDGSLWMWGLNDTGNLGVGNKSMRLTPTQVVNRGSWRDVAVSTFHTIAIKADGTLWGWGSNNQMALGITNISGGSSVPILVSATNNWRVVTVSENNSFVLNSSGALWACGLNGYGEIGNGTFNPSPVFIRVGTNTDWMVPEW